MYEPRTCVTCVRTDATRNQHLLVSVFFRDVFIPNDMDDLLERQKVAAIRRHPLRKYLDYVEIDGRHLFDVKHNQTGGIDAGVMLLKTST